MIEFVVSRCSESELSNFIREHYCDFDSNFKYICENKNYCHKLYVHSEKYEAWGNGKLFGLICVYVNNENKYIYIPYVCISSELRRKKVASTLLEKIIKDFTNDYLYIDLEVRIDNTAAFVLYTHYGFLEIGRNEKRIQMRKFL